MFALLPVGPWELILILAIVLIIVGPGKLPAVGRSIGKSISEFRKTQAETRDQPDLEQNKDSTSNTNSH